DDRNLPLDHTADQQSELALGYGRRAGDAWSFGGTVKVRHQALDGFSASGFGADLGVTASPGIALGVDAPWADRVTCGLVLSNIMRPNLKLDREAVADPSVVRAGVAYTTPVLGTATLVAAADLEQPSGLATRGHLGFALRLAPQFELRTGWSAG